MNGRVRKHTTPRQSNETVKRKGDMDEEDKRVPKPNQAVDCC